MSVAKRQRTESGKSADSVRNPDISQAAEFNRRVLRKLTKALSNDPEVDLASLLPGDYSSRLASRKVLREGTSKTKAEDTSKTPAKEEKADAIPKPQGIQPNQSTAIKVVYPLSTVVMSLLDISCLEHQTGENLSQRLCEVIESSTVIFRSTASDRYVAQCNQSLIVKVTELQSRSSSGFDYTEYKTMQYLAQQKPDFLAPELQGLLISGNTSYLFMTHIPGVTLESIWQHLATKQRQSLTSELEHLLLDLRRLPRLPQTPLGGVDGQGCKDMRRSIRFAKQALYTNKDFWQFLYGDAREKDTVYCQFLRYITWPPASQEIVFTHGDIRPANIIIQEGEPGHYHIGGIIDWEMSGFYPSDYECIRATNNLSTIGNDDWYLFLPPCLSPQEHFRSWITDRLWDPYVV